jgi:hypothetical protein
MLWLLFIPLQIALILAGARRARRAGQWSWSAFAFALGFAAFECSLIIAPILLVGVPGRPHFGVIWTIAWIVCLLNFVWFLRIMRNWKMPGPTQH